VLLNTGHVKGNIKHAYDQGIRGRKGIEY